MDSILTAIHIGSCFLLILVVLVQSGKGAEISASFGGSSQTVFGSSGGANFFTRVTATLAAVFMLTSLALTYLGNQKEASVFEGTPTKKTDPKTPDTSATKDDKDSKDKATPVKSAPAKKSGTSPSKDKNKK